MRWLQAGVGESIFKVFVGTVVVIAGVAFVVISAGVGLLVLVPVVLVASAGSHGALPLAGALA